MANVPSHKKGYKSCSAEQGMLNSRCSKFTFFLVSVKASHRIICMHVLLEKMKMKERGPLRLVSATKKG